MWEPQNNITRGEISRQALSKKGKMQKCPKEKDN